MRVELVPQSKANRMKNLAPKFFGPVPAPVWYAELVEANRTPAIGRI